MGAVGAIFIEMSTDATTNGFNDLPPYARRLSTCAQGRLT